jgi:DNA-binding CsgD family transcriptional regulator
MNVWTSSPATRTDSLPASLISNAIDGLGTPAFMPALLEGFNSIGDFSHMFAGSARAGITQFEPAIGYRCRTFEKLATMPLRKMDRDDPMYGTINAVLAREPAGTAFVGLVKSEEIVNPLRSELIFARNSLSMRIGLSILTDDQVRHFLCLYRHERSGKLDNAQRDWLIRAAPVALALLRKHRQIRAMQSRELELQTCAPLGLLCPELTERELQVCAGLLRGRTLEQIAARLDIGTTTARTYQQRAFVRLAIRTRQELFALVLPD